MKPSASPVRRHFGPSSWTGILDDAILARHLGRRHLGPPSWIGTQETRILLLFLPFQTPKCFIIPVLRTGTAHYNCHVSGIVLVKNPRPALYINSVAYTMDQQPCVTEHKLDNSLIEIYGCDMVSSVHVSEILNHWTRIPIRSHFVLTIRVAF